MWSSESLFLPLLAWYLVVQLIGLAGLPVCARLFPRLPDRGYAFARSLGLVLGGYVYWAGYAFGVWANSFPGAWVALFLTGAAAARLFAASCRERAVSARACLAEAWQRHRSYVILLEALFLVCFLGWALVRMEVPGVRHTEQFRNMMFLSGIWNSRTFPPIDPWLAGFPVCYYYFAYWVELFPARLIGMPPDFTFNIGQACWLALLVTSCFGMGYNLVASRGPSRTGRGSLLPFCGGMLSVLFVALSSNARGVLDALRNRGEFFWWWAASRAVTDEGPGGPLEIITEFPVFSYILGDNHPHVLVMPFTLLALAAAYQLLLQREEPGAGEGNAPGRLLARFPGRRAGLPAVLLLPASLYAMNSWDFPAAAALLASACLFGFAPVRRALVPTLLLAGLLAAAVLLFFFPYLLSSQSMFLGLVWNRAYHTSPAEYLRMFGLLLPGLVSLAASFLCRAIAPRPEPAPGAGTGAPRLVLGRFPPATFFAVLLGLCGLGLVALPEFVYVLDVFETRMNTIFKLYYQAWLLLGLASAFGLTLLFSRRWTSLFGVCGVLVACAGLLYPVRAIDSRARENPDPRTLDGSHWLRAFAPDELAAVDWVRKNTQPEDVIAEAPGNSYDVGNNRVSTLTGRAGLLGWQGHVMQFRGEAYEGLAAGRPEALQNVYLATNQDQLDAALRRFDIRYVYLGPHERATYAVTREREETLDGLMEVVFQQGAVKIYRPRRGR